MHPLRQAILGAHNHNFIKSDKKSNTDKMYRLYRQWRKVKKAPNEIVQASCKHFEDTDTNCESLCNENLYQNY